MSKGIIFLKAMPLWINNGFWIKTLIQDYIISDLKVKYYFLNTTLLMLHQHFMLPHFRDAAFLTMEQWGMGYNQLWYW